ncbi:hypothetical protein IV203_037318 [Nitzschia inconspicua]|uniref:Uncharacterized protein n=1 Tax=Nitzschia inconspicua TaxID=303405 RepID=A0A9K3LNP9_9STRA|nr:hypothetical protein IV203_006352 [Nitzschia inconspicua]KAG7364116.1 hypothetical protein IV203_037318 [Nitzschia inconspicua]
MTSDTKAKEESKSSQDLAGKLQGVAKVLFDFLCAVIPYTIKAGYKIHAFWNHCDDNVVAAFIGFVFCFFGGMFPTLFSAIQAAEQGGRAALVDAVSDLCDEAVIIIRESKKDDKEDKDGDGVEDIKQLDNKEYVKRKTLLVLSKCNPKKIDKALNAMYTVWLSVMAVLTVQFAKYIQMANSIAEFMKQPVERFVEPIVIAATPDHYDKWIPVILGWICEAIGISLAWTIASIQIAFASSMKGGLMLARAGYKALLKHNIRLGGLIVDNHEHTNIDEYASYVLAALGFMFQFFVGFRAPFPLNLLLWPFEIGEWIIRVGLMRNSNAS